MIVLLVLLLVLEVLLAVLEELVAVDEEDEVVAAGKLPALKAAASVALQLYDAGAG